MRRLDTTAEVTTPERVPFRYRLAGPGPRAVAWSIDVLVKGVVLTAVGSIAVLLAMVPGVGEAGYGMLLVAMFLSEWLYGALFEWAMGGRTPGKMVLRLRVLRTDGSPAGFADCFLRNLLRGVDFLPGLYLAGVLCQLVDTKLRRIGDLAAGTVVVREERAGLLSGVRIEPPISEEERRMLPPFVELTPQERTLIADLLRRRRRLGPALTSQLCRDLAQKVRTETGMEVRDDLRVLALAWARHTGRDRQASE